MTDAEREADALTVRLALQAGLTFADERTRRAFLNRRAECEAIVARLRMVSVEAVQFDFLAEAPADDR